MQIKNTWKASRGFITFGAAITKYKTGGGGRETYHTGKTGVGEWRGRNEAQKEERWGGGKEGQNLGKPGHWRNAANRCMNFIKGSENPTWGNPTKKGRK